MKRSDRKVAEETQSPAHSARRQMEVPYEKTVQGNKPPLT